MLTAAPSAPPAFAWEEWYAAAGGRTIRIEEAAEYMRKIREEQEPRFTGPVAADIVGICAIEPSACRKYCPPQAIPDNRSPEAGKDHFYMRLNR